MQWMQKSHIRFNKIVTMQDNHVNPFSKYHEKLKQHAKENQNLSRNGKLKFVIQEVHQNETTDDFKEFLNVSADRLQDNMLHLHNFKYIINQRNICKNKTVFVLTVIHSSAHNFKMRNLIRKTSKTFTNSEQERLVTIFLIAGTTDEFVQASIKEESSEHGDIIQGSFLDDYRNLTYKNVMGLHWIVNFCNHTKYVLKTDDDVLINPFHLVKFLRDAQRSRKYTDFLYCSLYIHHHPRRFKGDKWYTSENDYPQRTYPPYCEGFAYIMSVDVVKKFFAATPKVPFYWVDDVYVTGFLAYLSGVKHVIMSSYHGYTRISEKYSNKSIQHTLIYLSKDDQDSKHWFSTWKQIADHWSIGMSQL